METYRIDILNAKVKSILKELASLDLIRIKKETSKPELKELLEKFRLNSKDAPSLEDIQKEVEIVRATRHEK